MAARVIRASARNGDTAAKKGERGFKHFSPLTMGISSLFKDLGHAPIRGFIPCHQIRVADMGLHHEVGIVTVIDKFGCFGVAPPWWDVGSPSIHKSVGLPTAGIGITSTQFMILHANPCGPDSLSVLPLGRSIVGISSVSTDVSP